MEFNYKTPLETILKLIVSNPDQLRVEETQEGTIVILKVFAAKEDYGVIIGKGGKTIQSIRKILNIKAVRDQVKLFLSVDPEGKEDANIPTLTEKATESTEDASLSDFE